LCSITNVKYVVWKFCPCRSKSSGCCARNIIFDTHGSVHRRLLSRNTNKMQLCNRIHYSKVFWRLNMFRAAHRSSSGALNSICSLWFICPCGDRSLPRLNGKPISHSAVCQGWMGNPFPTQPWQRTVSIWVYKPEAANKF
jgi:hypothetical protein